MGLEIYNTQVNLLNSRLDPCLGSLVGGIDVVSDDGVASPRALLCRGFLSLGELLKRRCSPALVEVLGSHFLQPVISGGFVIGAWLDEGAVPMLA